MAELTFPAKHLQRVCSKARGKTPVFDEIAKRLASRLSDSTHTFPTVYNLSRDADAIARLLPSAQATLPPTTQADALLANLTLTTLDDAPATLHGWLSHLKPDGVFLASTLGAGSFAEWRAAFHAAGLGAQGHTTPLPDVQECGILLQRLKLAMPVVDRDIITLTFPTMAALLASHKAHASHNWHPARAKGLLTPRQFAKVCEAYASQFTRPDGRLPLTLEVIYLHGWKPHPTQQTPLKPGQGKVSLVRILGVD